jgi:hypothetical protein
LRFGLGRKGPKQPLEKHPPPQKRTTCSHIAQPTRDYRSEPGVALVAVCVLGPVPHHLCNASAQAQHSSAPQQMEVVLHSSTRGLIRVIALVCNLCGCSPPGANNATVIMAEVSAWKSHPLPSCPYPCQYSAIQIRCPCTNMPMQHASATVSHAQQAACKAVPPRPSRHPMLAKYDMGAVAFELWRVTGSVCLAPDIA